MASENRVTLGKAAQFRRHEPGRRLGTLPRGGYFIQGIAKGAMPTQLPEDAQRKPEAASQADTSSLKDRLRVTSIDGSVRWISPEGSDPELSIWTPEDEKLISACVF